MGLLEIIKEQIDFGFTGKINILSSRSQFLGAIFLKEGAIVGSQFHGLKGIKALKKAIFEDVDSRDFLKLVVEPEIVEEEHQQFSYDFAELKNEIEKEYENYRQSKKLRPPQNLDLVIAPEVVTSKDLVSYTEFKVLEVMAEYSKVSDIYEHCTLEEYEITQALVELRRKKAIKVFQNPSVVR